MRHTKIIATLGPASNSAEIIRELIAAGVNVFRLNFSHGTRDDHSVAISRIRDAEWAAGRSIGILQDLSGPKIRTGLLEGGTPITLQAGDELRIAAGDFVGGPGRVSTTYAELPKLVRPGDMLLLDDGHVQLRVEESDGRELRTVVVDGGMLGEHKGINAPGVKLPSGALTPKDAEDLAFGVGAGVDMVALSFVQTADDVLRAREELVKLGAPRLPIIAKLERPEAVEHVEAILHACDAVMIARGDLGLELPLERVPRVQKEITRRARSLGVPVILATQVLESMRLEPRPTRAEVSDAANAVDDGVDAIMLAGETAAGKFPVRAVQVLDMIIRDAELMPPVGAVPLAETHLAAGHGLALCEAAKTLAERGDVGAIVAVTRGGKTARELSGLRPRVQIFGATDRPDVSRQLTLLWGVVPVLSDLSGDVSEAASRICDDLVARDAIPRDASIVLVSLTPDLARGPSNFLKLQRA
jgi:pyruvate kinase